MSKKLITILLAVALVLSVALAFTACKDKTEPYPIPDNLTIDISLYNGDTLLGTISKDTLKDIAQEKITISVTNDYGTNTDSVYIGYSVTAIAAKLGITLPQNITSVKTVASDNPAKLFETEVTSLDNAYITIGFEEDGKFSADEKAPRFIPNLSLIHI